MELHPPTEDNMDTVPFPREIKKKNIYTKITYHQNNIVVKDNEVELEMDGFDKLDKNKRYSLIIPNKTKRIKIKFLMDGVIMDNEYFSSPEYLENCIRVDFCFGCLNLENLDTALFKIRLYLINDETMEFDEKCTRPFQLYNPN